MSHAAAPQFNSNVNVNAPPQPPQPPSPPQDDGGTGWSGGASGSQPPIGYRSAISTGMPATIAGRDIVIPPLNVRMLAMIEAEIVRRRPNPLEDAMRACNLLHDREDKALLMDKALAALRDREKVTADEFSQFIASDLSGIAFSFWVAIDSKYPGQFTQDAVLDWVSQKAGEDLQRLLLERDQDHAGGAIKNPTDPKATAEAETGAAKAGGRRRLGGRRSNRRAGKGSSAS